MTAEDRRVALAREELRRRDLDVELIQRGLVGSSDPAAPLLPLMGKLEKAVGVTGESAWDDVVWAVRSGDAILFHEGESVLVALGQEHPAGKTLVIWVVAGRRDEVVLLSRAAHLFAKDRGFTRMTALTRAPIAEWPEIKSDGWRKRAVWIEREV